MKNGSDIPVDREGLLYAVSPRARKKMRKASNYDLCRWVANTRAAWAELPIDTLNERRVKEQTVSSLRAELVSRVGQGTAEMLIEHAERDRQHQLEMITEDRRLSRLYAPERTMAELEGLGHLMDHETAARRQRRRDDSDVSS